MRPRATSLRSTSRRYVLAFVPSSSRDLLVGADVSRRLRLGFQTLYNDWGIQIDSVKENYALQLTKFDGSLMPPLYLVQRPPSMLPTVELTGYGLGLNVRPILLLFLQSRP